MPGFPRDGPRYRAGSGEAGPRGCSDRSRCPRPRRRSAGPSAPDPPASDGRRRHAPGRSPRAPTEPARRPGPARLGSGQRASWSLPTPHTGALERGTVRGGRPHRVSLEGGDSPDHTAARTRPQPVGDPRGTLGALRARPCPSVPPARINRSPGRSASIDLTSQTSVATRSSYERVRQPRRARPGVLPSWLDRWAHEFESRPELRRALESQSASGLAVVATASPG